MCSHCQPQEYECRYCGCFTEMDHDNEKSVRSESSGELETILVCDRCCKILAGELHRRNCEGLATIIHQFSKVAAE